MAFPGQFSTLAFIRRHIRGLDRKELYFPKYTVAELEQLHHKALHAFTGQGTFVDLHAPVTVCGDLRGQFIDLLRIFGAFGFPPETNYLFLGDYVHCSGPQSLEVLCLLLAYKVMHPESIYLLRGHHEVNISRNSRFYDELKRRFKDKRDQLFEGFNKVFDMMPLAGLINGRILCVHGGISPHLQSLNHIRNIQRPLSNVQQGLAQDLLFADPDNSIQEFAPNHLLFSDVRTSGIGRMLPATQRRPGREGPRAGPGRIRVLRRSSSGHRLFSPQALQRF